MSVATSELHRLALRVQLAAFPGPRLDDGAARLLEQGLGGICLFGSNTGGGGESVRALVEGIHQAGDHPLVAVDEEGGDVTRLHAATGSPTPGNAVLGVVDDLELTGTVGRLLGLELASIGIDLNLAPVADVNSAADNPIIGVRSFSADASLAARHVAAWVSGLQSAGVAACVKHFPGHGATAQDSHVDLPRLDVSTAVLRERELVPFAAAIGVGVDAVMTSHIVLAAIDADLPATLSAPVLRLLRTELGFEGAIVTDALDMAGASGGGRGIAQAAVMALAAGADLLCLGADKDPLLVETVRDALVEAVHGGRLPEARLRDAAARMDQLVHRRSVHREAGAAATEPRDARVAAARLALRIEGRLPSLAGALIVRLTCAPTIAVGPVPWGLDADVELDPGSASALDELRREVAERPLVVQVRDLHRQGDAAQLLTSVARLRPDVVVIEWGWPVPSDLPVARICTYGASAASRAAVEQLLRETTGWEAS